MNLNAIMFNTEERNSIIMDLNVLLPGNRAEASTDNGTKNEGEQKSKSHH